MTEIFQEIYHSLREGKELVLATIASSSGSTPRTSGSKMIVYGDGRISGTIGGGAVEGDVIQKALTLFTTLGWTFSSYNLNPSGNAEQMDLVCGGQMQVLMEHVPVNSKNIELYGVVCEEIQQSRSFLWIGKVNEGTKNLHLDRAIQTATRKWFGSFQQTDEFLEVFGAGDLGSRETRLVEVGQQRFVVESVVAPHTVYLVGGGHVSKEIAALTKQLGFRTVVIDDRMEFANSDRFRDADGVHVCPRFADVFADFDISVNSYIIIATRGHSFDKEVLGQALKTDAGYIGMIGSSRKRQSIYQKLLKEGFEQSLIDQVYCPIGLPIEAETPAEIGISVVAQLIQHRAGQKSRG